MVDLRTLYLQSLSEDASQPLLLILDGLDEAAFQLVNYFPAITRQLREVRYRVDLTGA